MTNQYHSSLVPSGRCYCRGGSNVSCPLLWLMLLLLTFITRTTASGEEQSLRRVAIVTGGTRGIGAGIAEALLSDTECCDGLLLTYNSNEQAAKAFAARLREQYPTLRCELVGGDLALEETRDAIFECYDKTFASSGFVLGAVIHNAGQYVGVTSSNAADLGPSRAQFGNGSLLDDGGKLNLECMKYYQALYGDAYIDLMERGIARMKHGGSLIGISSPGCNLSYNCHPGYSMPGSGKCIMEHTMRIFAVNAALHGKNINCNVIVPGVTLTEAWDKAAKEWGRGKGADMTSNLVARSVPMGRSIEPRGIGDVAAFLCSDKGRYVTGVSLPVDGGLHLGGMRGQRWILR